MPGSLPISIHALLAESDKRLFLPTRRAAYFYPRSPCGERPSSARPPARHTNFYPRSPCGERPAAVHDCQHHIDFYPRSPCGERRIGQTPIRRQAEFLSTLSLRRATVGLVLAYNNCEISIHALLAESDPQVGLPDLLRCDFYPRSPCGERPLLLELYDRNHKFLSTLSLRRATRTLRNHLSNFIISIHALLAESDPWAEPLLRWLWYFYPRSPCGERLVFECFSGRWKEFLSTLSLRRATPRRRRCTAFQTYFYPRSPCGERHVSYS